jgi:hypothetical protein
MRIKDFIICAAPSMRVGIMNGCDFVGVYDDAHDIPPAFINAEIWRIDNLIDDGRAIIELTIYQ